MKTKIYLVMEAFIPINEQIALTNFQPADKENLLRYMNDAVLYHNTLRVPNPYTEQDADIWMAKTEQEQVDFGTTVNWAIRDRELGVIGGIGSFVKTGLEGHSDEVGYWLAAPFRGNGIMTEVVVKFTTHLFSSRPALVRLEAWTLPTNAASGKVLEKAGFEREGYCRKMFVKNGEYRDAILFARIRQ